MIGTRIANFQITKELGTGGMGTVYKAKDLNLNRYVALKMLHSHIMSNSNSYKRFKNEAQISAQISHAHVAMLYDFIEVDGKSYIIMEYVDGHTLEEELQIKKKLSESECINITIQTLKGLSEAHELEILHRDLKPSNLMIKKNGYVKLMDFGIARMENATRLTAQNKVVGTIEYMAPEILKGQDPNRTSDLYAVGVMMHEMLTGKTLYKSQSEASLMYQIVNEKPQYDLNLVNSGLAKIIKKLVKKNPLHRYRTTLEVINDLEKVSRSIAAKAGSPKVSLPNIDISNLKNLVKLPSLANFNLPMGKGMKFILASVLISFVIVFLGSLFSEDSKNGRGVNQGDTTIAVVEEKGQDVAKRQNTFNQIEMNQFTQPRFVPNGIEIKVPQEKNSSKSNGEENTNVEKESQNSKTKKQTKTKRKTQPKNKTIEKTDKEENSVVEKKSVEKGKKQESRSIEIASEDDNSDSKNVENNYKVNEKDVKESESIEIIQEESKKQAVNIFIQEQYLPVSFGKVINSKNYNEGDVLEFRTAGSISVGSNIVIEKNAPVRARVSRKKVKNNGKVIFAIKIESVQAVNGKWIALSYPEYSDIQKGGVIIPASTTINKVKVESQQITIYK